MQELQTKAASAMHDIKHVSDPEVQHLSYLYAATLPYLCDWLLMLPMQAAVKTLASMAELAKGRITKVLGTIAESEEVESHLHEAGGQ
eukprot:scaffold185778_cov41-Prasinocladus_malaysianus.AAC.1